MKDEEDAEDRLIDAMSNSSFAGVGRKLKLALRMAEERPEAGLKLVEEVVSQAKQDGDIYVTLLAQRQYMRVASRLERYEETFAMVTESLESVKTYAGDSSDPAWIQQKYDFSETLTLACGMTGRFDESKRAFDELLESSTRIFGRAHQFTRRCFRTRFLLLHKMVFKAKDLLLSDDLANGARYLDAVLIESKAQQDFFDTKNPNFQINFEIMNVAADVLQMCGRKHESLAVTRLCLKSARERKDLDSELTQQCMWIYAHVSYDLYGLTKESKDLLDELVAMQTRLYGPDAPKTQETASFLFSVVNIST